ncbi:histidine phosphatase family protein [Leucobacter japonicus]|uniref:histidine phosphatase family protein n=1 Tax=Leucobacter japonicus TaxID=1461259 RepID=UPI0006A7E265|nr:histidine phosphatase family protein [Leucobacter japonicus]
MRLALIRHGQTDWNLAGRMQGRTNIPLNAAGRAQASDLARSLAEGEPWDAVVSSPLVRASMTGDVLAEHLGLGPVMPVAELVERSFGAAEGLSPGEALERWPDRQYPEMESAEAVATRARKALEHIAERRPDQRVLAVSHGSFIRHLLANVTSAPIDDIPRIGNTEMSILSRDAQGRWSVQNVAGAPLTILSRGAESGDLEAAARLKNARSRVTHD